MAIEERNEIWSKTITQGVTDLQPACAKAEIRDLQREICISETKPWIQLIRREHMKWQVEKMELITIVLLTFVTPRYT